MRMKMGMKRSGVGSSGTTRQAQQVSRTSFCAALYVTCVAAVAGPALLVGGVGTAQAQLRAGDAGIAAALFGARLPAKSEGVVFGANVTPAAVAIPATGASAANGAASTTGERRSATDGDAGWKMFGTPPNGGQTEDSAKARRQYPDAQRYDVTIVPPTRPGTEITQELEANNPVEATTPDEGPLPVAMLDERAELFIPADAGDLRKAREAVDDGQRATTHLDRPSGPKRDSVPAGDETDPRRRCRGQVRPRRARR